MALRFRRVSVCPLATEGQLRCRRLLIDQHQLSHISFSITVSKFSHLLIDVSPPLSHPTSRRHEQTIRYDNSNDRTASEVY